MQISDDLLDEEVSNYLSKFLGVAKDQVKKQIMSVVNTLIWYTHIYTCKMSATTSQSFSG